MFVAVLLANISLETHFTVDKMLIKTYQLILLTQLADYFFPLYSTKYDCPVLINGGIL